MKVSRTRGRPTHKKTDSPKSLLLLLRLFNIMWPRRTRPSKKNAKIPCAATIQTLPAAFCKGELDERGSGPAGPPDGQCGGRVTRTAAGRRQLPRCAPPNRRARVGPRDIRPALELEPRPAGLRLYVHR